MDLKKEIKLSDLFRRRPKEAEEATGPDAEPEGKRRLLAFGPRRAKEAAEPKPPKEPRRKGKKGTPPLPEVPLMRAFDLMPKEDGRRELGPDEDGDRRRPGTVQLVLGVVGLLLVAVLASIFLITNATVADKQAELDDLKTRLAALNVAAEKPKAPEPDQALVQERDNRTGALALALGQRIAWDRILREISLVLPENVWLTSLRTQAGSTPGQGGAAPDPNAVPTPATFELAGYTRKQETVAQLLSRMGVLPDVAAVRLVSSSATTIGDEDVVEFSIAATMKPAGAGGTT